MVETSSFPPGGGPSGTTLKDTLVRGDVMFGLGLMTILVVLILPMPTWLLDGALAISLTLSILVLMTALFIEKPLDFSSFPTVLLVTTMLRLALNVASTRLILSRGHEGPHAAGEVIQAFGNFIMGGNFVIGLIVFSILVIVNFVVITKGSGRIAEVSARFSLDSMPGKQMAIDADLSAGLIDEAEAKRRRAEVEGESNFFGAMDGAAKFVRGDAIAGLFITVVNVVAGIIIGTVQNGVSLSEAATSYTLLTVGDGLISQVPALIVSTAAGMLVSKSASEGSADRAFFAQLGAYPQALGISSFAMVVLGILPGTPKIPFLLLAGVTGAAAWQLSKREEAKKAEDAAQKMQKETDTDEVEKEDPIANALHIDQIRLELGYGLLGLIQEGGGPQSLAEQIKSLRGRIAHEVGFVIPSVRIQDNMQLSSDHYMIRIKEIQAGTGLIRPNMLMVMDPQGNPIEIPGEPTTDPAFGLAAKWISTSYRGQAESLGLTIVDPATIITTHLTENIKDHMPELFSFTETQSLLDSLQETHKKLIADMIPSQISTGGVQRVLQSLLAERVSIRDISTILEGISEACTFTRDIASITEHVRSRLARQICAANADENQVLPVITLSPDWDHAFHESIVSDGETKQLAIPPSTLQDFSRRVREIFDTQGARGETPILLTNPVIRPYVRSVVERFRPATVVMSQAEIHPRARLKTIDQI